MSYPYEAHFCPYCHVYMNDFEIARGGHEGCITAAKENRKAGGVFTKTLATNALDTSPGGVIYVAVRIYESIMRITDAIHAAHSLRKH